jgi:histidinol-phosphatase (PHP family)
VTLTCIHTHTIFCDGTADVETMCAAAFARGFASIGFSSHAPIAGKTGIKTTWHLADEKQEEYIGEVLGARKRWEGKLKVYLGMEIDYIEGLCGPADRDWEELPLDYSIGSVHYVIAPKNGEPFAVDSPGEEFGRGFADFFDNDGRALYHAYYDACIAMIRAGGFQIAGHLDLVKKNNGLFRFFSPGDGDYRKRLAETADALAAARNASDRGPAAELNTGGMIRGRIADPYPSLDMLRLLKDAGVPLVITSDAHAPDQLGGFYQEGREAMKRAGYHSTIIFEGRQNGGAVWREEPL